MLQEYSAVDEGSNTTGAGSEGGTSTPGDGGTATDEGGTATSEGGTSTSEAGAPADAGRDGATPFDAGPSVNCGMVAGGSAVCEDFEGTVPPTAWTAQADGTGSIAKGAGRTSAGSARFLDDPGTVGAGTWLTRSGALGGVKVTLTLSFVVDAAREGGTFVSLTTNASKFDLVLDDNGDLEAVVGEKPPNGNGGTRALGAGWHTLRVEMDASTQKTTATLDGTAFLSATPFTSGGGSIASYSLKIGSYASGADSNAKQYATVRFDDVLLQATAAK